MHRLRTYTPRALVAAGVIAAGTMGAAPASAKTTTIRCRGNGDGCVASVSIAGGVSNQTVVIQLTDTDFSRIALRVTDRSSRGKFSIRNPRKLLGGSEYIFTLNAAKSNPRFSRIILVFAAGIPA